MATELVLHQGCGIGMKLMNAVKKWATPLNIDALSVTVYAANQDGHVFYEKLGFVEQKRMLELDI